MNPIRTLIIDDHDVMRFGLTALLNRESDIKVVAEAQDAHSALVHFKTGNIDVALLDLTLPDADGLQFIKLLKSRYPQIPVIVSTMHDELRYGDRAIAAGARGYVMKTEPPRVLVSAIRAVAEGGWHISDELKGRIGFQSSEKNRLTQPHGSVLTDRELEVLHLLGLGLSSAEIALRLHRSIKTIDSHRENIKKKLALRNASELMRYAMYWVLEEGRPATGNSPLQNGIIPPGAAIQPTQRELSL